MKTKLGVVVLLTMAVISAAAQTNDLTLLLQQGLFEEQANRNLDAAIADYQTLAQQFDRDRQLAATAIFRLGECYRAQGKTNDAAGQYQRIIRDFSDQQTLVTLSRQDLAGLGVQPDETAAQARRQQKDLLVKQIALAQQDADDLEKRVQTGLASTAEARAAEAQVLRLQQQLAALDAGVGGQTGLGTPVRSDEDQEIARIQDLIQNSPDLINAPKDGCTPLVKAAYNGWLKVAGYLLDHGATVNTACPRLPGGDILLLDKKNEATPLLAAVAAGNKSMTEFLIQHGAEVDLQVGDGVTPLDLAAQMGFEEVVKVLLSNKAAVNAQTASGTTPIFFAARNGKASVVNQLLAAGAKVDLKDNHGQTVLDYAVESPPEVMKLLLKAGANPNATDNVGRTPLSYAAEKTKSDLVKILLEAKADPNLGEIDLPLLCSLRWGDLDSAKLLLAAGANPNVVGVVNWSQFSVGFGPDNTGMGHGYADPLWLAVTKNSLSMVHLLLKFKAAPNGSQIDGHQLIFDALDNSDILAALLEGGANPNVISSDGSHWTPLVLALRENHVEAVKLLLKHGADTNDESYGKEPALFLALVNTNLLEAMLSAGANIEARDGSANVNGYYPDWTPLLAAVWNNHPTAAEVLLKEGANPNATDAQGNTALHRAVDLLRVELKAENLEMVTMLLDHGANPNVRNNDGFTPLELVKRRHNGEGNSDDTIPQQIASLLRQHGALDNLPHWDYIMVGRPAANFSSAIFRKGTNDWNHFTLLETILNFYDSSRTYSVTHNGISESQQPSDMMPFPDLSRVVIVRPSHDSTNETRMVINLLNSTNGIDVAKDVPLEFGDVVDIPERDHALGESTQGLTTEQKDALVAFARGHVELRAHGQKVELEIGRLDNYATLEHALGEGPAQQLLLVSSDLSRVKVIRHDAKTGKSQEWVVDCSGNASSAAERGTGSLPVFMVPLSFRQRLHNLSLSTSGPDSSTITDLWLRDGDVIEVPEKQ